jgi:hypothetical protein
VDPGVETQLPARKPVDAVEEAIRRSLAVLEVHRQRALRLAQSKRPTERQQGSFLVAAIDRLERYLHVAKELTDWDAMRVWVEGVLADEASEHHRSHRRRSVFTGSAHRKAIAAARTRFEAIAAEVIDRLERALANPSDPERNGRPKRCVARTRRGSQCKNPAVETGLCELHSRIAADPELAPIRVVGL